MHYHNIQNFLLEAYNIYKSVGNVRETGKTALLTGLEAVRNDMSAQARAWFILAQSAARGFPKNEEFITTPPLDEFIDEAAAKELDKLNK